MPRIALSALALVAATLTATPAFAAPASAPVPPVSGVVPPELTRALADPAMAERLGQVAAVLARSLMTLPAGEIEAAIEGRAPTAADRARTVRDVARIDDPDFERRLASDTAVGARVMQDGARAMASALPGILASMDGVRDAMDRAVANLPNPAYPRR